MSEKVPLSIHYINHSIRPTNIETLDTAGFEARHICAASGHRSEETIKCYAHRCPPKKKREMADTLLEKLGNPAKRRPTATQSIPQPEDHQQVELKSVQSEEQQDIPTINLEQFNDFVPIENNVDDFQLSNIINDLEHIEAQNRQL